MTSGLGTKIVLTASATEMSDFSNSPFMAFVGGFGKGPIPLFYVRKSLYPHKQSKPDGQASYAPYGLRKLESILLEGGFDQDDIAVVYPEHLGLFIGPSTKVVGISSMDPTGMGYVSKTYSSIVGGGEPMNRIEFRKLVMHPAIRKYGPKVIVGGYGSWQLERQQVSESYGVDCVLMGGRPGPIVELFQKAVSGEPIPRVAKADESLDNWNYVKEMPLIRNVAIHGAVEISKGCGRNCQFCTPTMQHKIDMPLEKILQEVELSVKQGSDHITLITEDLFLYGQNDPGFAPNREAIVKLCKNVARHPGVNSIQAAHMSLAPVCHSPDMIRDVAELLIEKSWYSFGGKPIITAETGVETGSPRLMKKYMGGKMLPYQAEQWPEIVTNAFGILNDNDWYPLATLIIGLPDEKEEDMLQTLELMDDLKDYNAFYVPLFFVPLENCVLMNKKGAEMDSLSKARWDFFIKCWEYNIKIWKPSFLESRLHNPFIYKTFDKILIPYFGRILGAYYALTRRGQADQFKEAVYRLSLPMPDNGRKVKGIVRARQQGKKL
ncbi:MAG: B12-binding domain-containing radical SAM protein [Candidatus Bathyarchaeota archaeon]|nr:B12-binding domain-containing radical SAM protein [Candidatus Termiticorpusculum sp.]MCL1969921.1 B12-binding domain-containing radical SAM protein [Candidatus Termiticorpusculum sp.]